MLFLIAKRGSSENITIVVVDKELCDFQVERVQTAKSCCSS